MRFKNLLQGLTYLIKAVVIVFIAYITDGIKVRIRT